MCGRTFRARSPGKVVDELEWLSDTFGAGAFAFYDDTFTFDVNRAVAICDEMKKRKLDLPWDCRTRVDRVSKDLLSKLSSTGCQLIHFGVESGSQQMLNLMRKGTTVEQNAQAIKWAKEAGISVAISLVIGYPTETPAMLKQTIDFIYKTKPDYVYMCEAVPYPGTELYEYTKKLGLELVQGLEPIPRANPSLQKRAIAAFKAGANQKRILRQILFPTVLPEKETQRRLLQPNHGAHGTQPPRWQIPLFQMGVSTGRQRSKPKKEPWRTQHSKQTAARLSS